MAPVDPDSGNGSNDTSAITTTDEYIGNNNQYITNEQASTLNKKIDSIDYHKIFENADAIFVLDRDANTGLHNLGHASVFIKYYDEDGNEKWYFTEYNKDSSTKEIKIFGKDVSESFMITYISNPDRYPIYLNGDYFMSYIFAKYYNERGTYPAYNLVWNNCLHYAKHILRMGKNKYSGIQNYIENTWQIFPRAFYRELGSIHNEVIK